MPRVKKRLTPDYSNADPFRGLPPNFPTSHSRFPAVPSDRYAQVPDVTEPTDDARIVGAAVKRSKPSAIAKRAWRDLARRAEAAKKRSTVKA